MPGVNDASIRWDRDVTSPFTKLTRSVYPRTIRETFAWAEELWMHHGMYSQSISTAVRYFMTAIEIEGDDLDFEARKKYRDKASSIIDILGEAAVAGDDLMAFGNEFTTIHRPFIRQLQCRNPKCGFMAPIRKMEKFFKFSNGDFDGKCPSCSWHGKLKRIDRGVPKESIKPVVVRWPPQYMEINWHPISQRRIFELNLPEYTELRDGIVRGDMLYLEDTPWEIVQAAVQNVKFKFNDDEIFHMAFPAPACCLPNLKGWGIPPFMADFETAVLVTMLDKYVETILVDYLMPFRVFSPPTSGDPTTDPLKTLNLGGFVQEVKQMLRRHRRNPTDFNFFPFPMDYQVFGGEAKDLLPVEILEHFEGRLLHSMGIPPEFYKASIRGYQASAGPVIGFKMFERTWQQFANNLNAWATWVLNKIGEIFKWEKVRASLKEVSVYEDPMVQQTKLELAAAGEISKDTAYGPMGIDMELERSKKIDEMAEDEEFLQRQQRLMENRQVNMEVIQSPPAGAAMLGPPPEAGMGGGMPPPAGGAGMAPIAPAGSTNASLDDIMLQADQLAQQILTMDSTTRKSQLLQLSHTNEALHAMVKAKLSQLENMAKTQGVVMARSGQVPIGAQ